MKKATEEKIWEYIHITPILKENTGEKVIDNAINCALIAINYEINTIEKIINICNNDNSILMYLWEGLKELKEIKKELENKKSNSIF